MHVKHGFDERKVEVKKTPISMPTCEFKIVISEYMQQG